ncbi:YcxB family protein [Streptomyces monomycini]|uniref:YcxB family protein n=1 Tax=Streptomyces monomycini TaxID=371720 RepID=UPI0007C5CF55|nr:YcxB family protein [Streptomyces monomycini]
MSAEPHSGAGAGTRIEFAYRMAVEDFRDGLRARARVSVAARRYRVLVIVGAVLLLGVMVWTWAAQGTVDVPLVVIPVALLVMMFVSPRMLARQFHRRTEAMGEFRAVVDESGVTVTNRQRTSTLTWRAVNRYAETPRAFVLLSGDRNITDMTILPKRGASHPADAERLRALIEGRLTRV